MLLCKGEPGVLDPAILGLDLLQLLVSIAHITVIFLDQVRVHIL